MLVGPLVSQLTVSNHLKGNKMIKLTQIDTPMHGLREIRFSEYLPYTGYFKWTKRDYYWHGWKVWSRKIDWRECDVYELARRVCGS